MSASEKLKALEQEAYEALAAGVNPPTDRMMALADALPQIVAVVEAAEKWPKHGDDGWIHVHSALAALDEALS